MRHRRRLLSSDDSTREIWPSFTDVTSTIALILFVLVLLAYVRDLVAGRRLQAFQQQIESSERKLRGLAADLRRTTAEIQTGRAELAVADDRLKEQQGMLAENQRELGGLRSRLQGIAVLRVDVLNKVKRSIEAELRPTNKPGTELVHIGDNGNIVINENLVFEYNSYAIKKEGKPLLDTLARALGKLLADPGVRENIDAVLIQGHTDERGSSSFNRELSAKRSGSVLAHLFEANKVLEESYGSYFASSAYSKFRPLNSAKTETAYEQNRRIEISVVLKDANVRKVIDDYMQNVNAPIPAGPAAP